MEKQLKYYLEILIMFDCGGIKESSERVNKILTKQLIPLNAQVSTVKFPQDRSYVVNFP